MDQQAGPNFARAIVVFHWIITHYLVVPFMLYNLEPGPRSMLASRMPPEMMEQLVPVAWKDRWASMKPFLLE